MAEQVSSLKTGIKYKDTPIGKIPVDWEVGRLRDLCIGEAEYGANVPSMDKDNNLPRYVRITDITDNGKLLESTSQSINKESAQAYLLGEGDFLFARSGATVGKSYLYRKKDGECAFAGYLIRFKPDSNQLLPEFLFHFTHSDYYYNWVKGILRAGAQPNINAKEYSNMLLPKPPIGEQKGIVEILTTVDEAIEKTDQIIEKTKEVKKGLMQKLLTRGIGHKKFKKTEIGEIPEEWEVMKLEEVCDEIYRYPTYYNIKYDDQNQGVPEVRGELIKNNGELSSDLSEYRYVSKETSFKFPRTILHEGDLVLSVRGTMGKIGYIQSYLEGANMTANLMRISPNRNKVHPLWVKQFFMSDFFQHRLDAASSSTTIKTIKAPELKEIELALPPLNEQKQIAEILTSLDQEIKEETTCKEQIELLKKGLMQVLLTGKIRIKI